MTGTERIPVENRHVRGGSPGSNTGCPMALALKDAGYRNPVVYVTQVELDGRSYVSSSDVKQFQIDAMVGAEFCVDDGDGRPHAVLVLDHDGGTISMEAE